MEHKTYKCKCGAVVFSKCLMTRSIFASNDDTRQLFGFNALLQWRDLECVELMSGGNAVQGVMALTMATVMLAKEDALLEAKRKWRGLFLWFAEDQTRIDMFLCDAMETHKWEHVAT